MSLREELVRRLANLTREGFRLQVDVRATGDGLDVFAVPDAEHFYGRVADECIRQMEAAWCQGSLAGADETMSCGYDFERALRNEYPEQGPLRRDAFYPLRLAPPDWQPHVGSSDAPMRPRHDLGSKPDEASS